MGQDTEIKKTVEFLISKDSDIRKIITDVLDEHIKNKNPDENDELKHVYFPTIEIKNLGLNDIDFRNKFNHHLIGSPFENMTQDSIELLFRSDYVSVRDIFAVMNNLQKHGYDVKFSDLELMGSGHAMPRYRMMVYKKHD